MYIAMNRFKVRPEATDAFERIWLERETHLEDLPGFIEFNLLRGPVRDDHVLYSSHTLWRSEEDFTAWTQSEAFRKAHANAGKVKREEIYLGPPVFEGFTSLQTVKASG